MPPWYVTRVETAGPLQLVVRFADGTEGRSRIKPSTLSGVFEPLGHPAFFEQVSSDNRLWPCPARSTAPDAMHDQIRAWGDYVFA